MSAEPLVSVVIATYNRSDVLECAMRSVQGQTVRDWEMIVVGDACTDDTQQVVESLADPRIRFINLATNVGEQSGPNNEGIRLARGRYLALLNHDDLWLPQHLQSCLTELQRQGADLVGSLIHTIHSGGRRHLSGAAPRGVYEPIAFWPASCWLMKRELADEIGPWRSYRECYSAPSQQWLLRAHRAGKRMCQSPRVTLVTFPSSSRPGCYRRGAAGTEPEQKAYLDRMAAEPDFIERELTFLALAEASRPARWYFWPALRHVFKTALYRCCGLLGIAPSTLTSLLWYGPRKGDVVNQLRKNRGLPPIPRKKREPLCKLTG